MSRHNTKEKKPVIGVTDDYIPKAVSEVLNDVFSKIANTQYIDGRSDPAYIELQSKLEELDPDKDYSTIMELMRAYMNDSRLKQEALDNAAFIEQFNRPEDGESLTVVKRPLSSTELLHAALDIEGVPPEQREALVAKIKIEIARATRPSWKERIIRGGELATLSAPLYLKRVHADDIEPDGSVRTEVIRAIDAELMKTVELYISKRLARPGKVDLGDAEGLKLVLSRPGRRDPAKLRGTVEATP